MDCDGSEVATLYEVLTKLNNVWVEGIDPSGSVEASNIFRWNRFLPGHCVEYSPELLKHILEKSVFGIKHLYRRIYGMTITLITGDCYEDLCFSTQLLMVLPMAISSSFVM
jgi:hypothetical protein